MEHSLVLKLPLGEEPVDDVHCYEKRFRKHFQECLHINQPVYENFSVIWENVTLTRHIGSIWKEARFCLPKPHLNPVYVVQVFLSDQLPLAVMTQVADGEAVFKLAYLTSDQISLRQIYLLLLLRISRLVNLFELILLGPDYLGLCVTV